MRVGYQTLEENQLLKSKVETLVKMEGKQNELSREVSHLYEIIIIANTFNSQLICWFFDVPL